MSLIDRRLPPVVTPISRRALWQAMVATWTSGNEMRERLSVAIAERMHQRVVQLTDSGTSALRLALSLSAPRGSLIAIPAFGCIDVAAAVQGAGHRATLYDVEPSTLAPDMRSMEEAIARGARVVIASHLFGYAIRMRPVRDVCDADQCVFIEDAAQAFGASWDGAPAGSLGDFTVMSFGRGKGIGGGGGGALLARSEWQTRHQSLPQPTNRVDELRTVAIAAAMQVLTAPSVYAIPASLPFLRLGEMVYHRAQAPERIGRAAAALAEDSVRRLGEDRLLRERIARRLIRAAELGDRCTPVLPDADSSPGWLRVPMLLRNGVEPEVNLGMYRAYPRVVPEQTEILDVIELSADPLHGARLLSQRLVTVPCHLRLSEHDVLRLETWLSHPSTDSPSV